MQIVSGQLLDSTAQGFVLWAAERIRAEYSGGKLTWQFVFAGLGLAPPDYELTRWLVERGLQLWRRPLRRSDDGSRDFYLYALVAEGGLPDAALAGSGRYRGAVLAPIGELEAEGTLAALAAPAAAWCAAGLLPQALRNADQAQLLADLALALIDLRRALPADLPAEAAVAWLDAHRSGWRPIRPMSARRNIRPSFRAPAQAQRAGFPGRPHRPAQLRHHDGDGRGPCHRAAGGQRERAARAGQRPPAHGGAGPRAQGLHRPDFAAPPAAQARSLRGLAFAVEAGAGRGMPVAVTLE